MPTETKRYIIEYHHWSESYFLPEVWYSLDSARNYRATLSPKASYVIHEVDPETRELLDELPD